MDEPTPDQLKQELETTRASLRVMALSHANEVHDRRSLYSELVCCTVSFYRNFQTRNGSNINQLMGMLRTDDDFPSRFAPESRGYFQELWDIYDLMVAAPSRAAKDSWQSLTHANDPRLDFRRFRRHSEASWEVTASAAQVLPAPKNIHEFYLTSAERIVPPHADCRIEYTAWADEDPCDLSVVLGTDFELRDESHRALLRNPSSMGYCFAFGGFNNTQSMLQRNLRGNVANSAVRIVPGQKHRVIAERIGGRFSMWVDGVQAFEYWDLAPVTDPAGHFLSLYCANPLHHFEDLTVKVRESSLTDAEWQRIDASRRVTLKYTYFDSPRYFDSQFSQVLTYPNGDDHIMVFFKNITEIVVEHQRAERLRQAEAVLRESNIHLEAKVAERTRELNQVLEKLRASEQRFALAALGSNDGVWDWNLETNAVHFSPRWKEILGYSDKDVANSLQAWYGLVVPEDLSPLKQAMEAHFAGGTASFEHEYRMQHKNGTVRWVLTRGAAIRNQAGAPLRIAGSQTDITSRKSTELTLRHDAMHDPLTGLPNRATFRLKVAEAMHLRDSAGKNFAILFLDLDGFKTVNDTLGHLVGDQILIGIARRLEGVVRPGDVVARLGGDEFVVLLKDISGKTGVDRVAERILGAFESPFSIQGQTIPVGASVGIAIGRKQFKTPEEIIRKADSAMYHVKMAKKK